MAAAGHLGPALDVVGLFGQRTRRAQDFAREGGVIGFALVDKTVRFDINLKAAERAELRVSSKLLAVARSIVE